MGPIRWLMLGSVLFLLAPPQPLRAAPPDPARVAVLDFADCGPSVELASLRFAFAEMLNTELFGYQGLVLAERSRVEELIREKNLERAALTDRALGGKLGTDFPAEYIIDGSFSGKDGRLTLVTRLRRLGAERPQLTDEWTGTAEELPRQARSLALRIRDALGTTERVPPAALVDSPRIPSLAILGFRNLSPTTLDASFVDALPELLQTNLSTLPEIPLVERAWIAEIIHEQKLGMAGLSDPAARIALGKLLGAECLVFGSATRLGDEVRVDLRVTRTGGAAVVHAIQVTRPANQFPTLVEDLTAGLTAGLSLNVPAEALAAMRAAAPAANDELRFHLAYAARALQEGQRSDALGHLDRALLLDPANLTAIRGKLDILIHARQFAKAAETASQALNREFAPAERPVQRQIAYWLASAWGADQQWDKAADLCRKMIAENQGRGVGPQANFANLLDMVEWMRGDRQGQRIAQLEVAYADAKAKNDVHVRAATLRRLFESWYGQMPDTFPGAKPPPPEFRQRRIRRLLELYAEILEVGQRPNLAWKEWHHHAIGYATYYGTFGGSRDAPHVFTHEQQEARVRATLRTFAWDYQTKYRCLEWLARRMEATDRPGEALAFYRELEAIRAKAKPSAEIVVYQLPHPTAVNASTEIDAGAERVMHQAKLAVLESQVDGHQEKLRARLGELALDHGLVSRQGLYIAEQAARRGVPISSPHPLVLVWGGGEPATRSWNRFLKPLGARAHGVELPYVTAADLEPYSLVVLQNHHRIPFTPQGILAIRSYVARGGSILVIPEPGWDAASPGVLNPLLAFFGVQAKSPMIVEAKATRFAAHPITRGFTAAMAKCAAPLSRTADSPLASLVESPEGTLLAAGNYRRGRVVVASFGQWWLPEHDVKHKKRVTVVIDWNMKGNIETSPFEIGPRLETGLLKSVVTWLLEPAKQDPPRPLGDEFARAQQIAREAMLGLRSPSELRLAMDQLVAATKADEMGEEALWVAGLAFEPYSWTSCQADRARSLGTCDNQAPRALAPEYFELARDLYPDSSLFPYAEWFVADVKRREAVAKQLGPAGRDMGAFPCSVPESVAWFSALSARAGTEPWAWARIRLSQQYLAEGAFAKGIETAGAVVETIPQGPEKLLAALLLVECAWGLGDRETAARHARAASDMPRLDWPVAEPIYAWARITAFDRPRFETQGLDSRGFARLLRDIAKPRN